MNRSASHAEVSHHAMRRCHYWKRHGAGVCTPPDSALRSLLPGVKTHSASVYTAPTLSKR